MQSLSPFLVVASVSLGGSTTQSADCEEATDPKSAFNQVYVHSDPSAGQVLVENCLDEGPWPSTPKESPWKQRCAA